MMAIGIIRISTAVYFSFVPKKLVRNALSFPLLIRKIGWFDRVDEPTNLLWRVESDNRASGSCHASYVVVLRIQYIPVYIYTCFTRSTTTYTEDENLPQRSSCSMGYQVHRRVCTKILGPTLSKNERPFVHGLWLCYQRLNTSTLKASRLPS